MTGKAAGKISSFAVEKQGQYLHLQENAENLSVPDPAIIVRRDPGGTLPAFSLRNRGVVLIRRARRPWYMPVPRRKGRPAADHPASDIPAAGENAAGISATEENAAVTDETPEDSILQNKEPAITVSDLVIRYRNLSNVSIKKQLLNRHRKKSGGSYFEALHGISFEVGKGEILGIIGKNGSGKSTLLKTIGGIFSPDRGSVDLHGHNVSLLSIGVGFQKELSGRENIILSGLLLGYREKEIRAKTDEIIEFSELGDFIDRPVRTYSSGMYSKLAFSITAVLKTDIMLIDEVLSVGDQHFRKKSYAKMKSLISNKDRTVVIVSHSIRSLNDLCTKVLWLHEGNIVKIGPAGQVLQEYQAFMEQ